MKRSLIVFLTLVILGLAMSAVCPSCHPSKEERDKVTKLTTESGFFERHPLIVELILFPVFLLVWAAAMASPVGYQTINTEYWNWPGTTRVGTSYTDIPVPKQPASDRQIYAWLKWMTIGYIAFRFTCMSFFLPAIYQVIGSFLDLIIRQIFG